MSAMWLGGPGCPAHPFIYSLPFTLVPGGQEKRKQDIAGVGVGSPSPAGGTWPSLFSEATSLPGRVRGCLGWGVGCSCNAREAQWGGAGRGLGEATFSFTGVPLAFPEGLPGPRFRGSRLPPHSHSSAQAGSAGTEVQALSHPAQGGRKDVCVRSLFAH